MATPATAPTSENPKEHTDLNSKPLEAEDTISVHGDVSTGEDGESKGKTAETAEANGGAVDIGSGADIQKKMKRAERFGVPVQLSEEDKRNSRAERFGTGSTANGSGSAANGSNTSKQLEAEELKRKARAERFGLCNLIHLMGKQRRRLDLLGLGLCVRLIQRRKIKRKQG